MDEEPKSENDNVKARAVWDRYRRLLHVTAGHAVVNIHHTNLSEIFFLNNFMSDTCIKQTCLFEAPVKLENQTKYGSGLPVVWHSDSSSWVHICESGWNTEEASVFCNQIGLGPAEHTGKPNI